MTNVPDDELISAYLDGELSGEDLSRAEQLLAKRPESRQLLEELSALRASLQGLPKSSLGASFPDRVLRRAEREMLQPRATTSAPASDRRDEFPLPLRSWRRWQRPLAWSALAIAAGLLIMAFSPEQQEIAVAPALPEGELHAPRAPEALARHESSAPAGGGGQAPMSAAPALTKQLEPASDVAGHDADEEVSLQLFDTGADRLLVVECDVATLPAAEATLQSLLTTNQIQWQPNLRLPSIVASKEAVAGVADTAKKPVARSGGRDLPAAADALYIVADRTQLQTAVQSMTQNSEFRNVRLSQVAAPADTLAAFDQRANAVAEPADVTDRVGSAPESPKPAAETNLSPAAPSKTESVVKPLPTSPKAMTAGNDAKDNVDKQQQVRLRKAGQAQLGGALQLPVAEAQTNFGVPELADGAGPADSQRRGVSMRSQQRTPYQQRAITQAQQDLGGASRALIIMHVAPDSAPPDQPAARP